MKIKILTVILLSIFFLKVEADLITLEADYDEQCIKRTLDSSQFIEFNNCTKKCNPRGIYIMCLQDCGAPESCTYGKINAENSPRESISNPILLKIILIIFLVGLAFLYFYVKKGKN